MILNHKCSRSVDQFYRINVLWLPLLKSSLINCVVSFSEAVHQKCRSCPKQIRVKRKWQILASQNLPRLEGALFQGLGAWRIIFFYIRNHFLKIHAQGIPKMSDFYVFSHFWPRKWLLKLKKRVLTPSFSHLTFSSQMGTLSSACLTDSLCTRLQWGPAQQPGSQGRRSAKLTFDHYPERRRWHLPGRECWRLWPSSWTGQQGAGGSPGWEIVLRSRSRIIGQACINIWFIRTSSSYSF